MKKSPLLLFLVLFISNQLGAQEIPSSTFDAFQVFQVELLKKDSATVISTLQHWEQNAKNKDVSVWSMALQGIYYKGNFANSYQLAISIFEEALSKTENLEEITKFQIEHYLGYSYCRMGDFHRGLRLAIQAEYYFESTNFKGVFAPEEYLYNTSHIYYLIGNLEKAEELLYRVLDLTTDNDRTINAYNALGIIHSDNRDHLASIQAFKKVLEWLNYEAHSAKIGAVYGNLGIAFLRSNQLDSAKYFLSKSLELTKANNDWKGRFSTELTMGELYEKIDSTQKSLDHLEKAFQILKNYGVKDLETWISYYTILAKNQNKLPNSKEEIITLRRLVELKDSLIEVKTNNDISRMEMRLNAEKFKSEVQAFEQEAKYQKSIRHIIMILFVMGISLIFFLTYRYRQRIYKRQRILETQKIEAEKRLSEIKRNIQVKNQLIEEFKSKLNENEEAKASKKIVGELQHTIILTDDDWRDFKRQFEKAYPGLLQELRANYPDLSVSELRLLALIRLNLSVNEMANTLGILPHSVRKTRLRLMKKLALDDHKEIVSLLRQIESSQIENA